MQERKCFVCRSFEHIIYHCRNREEIEKNRRAKVRGPEHWLSSDKLLKEVIVKIVLKQKDNKDGITVEMLLDSGMTWLVISSKFARKNKFKKKKLDRPIYKECGWYL